MFEGKNLIVIMVESGNEIMLNSEYYPNIQRLVENGLHFTNNYSPRNICSTGNNEMGAMISLYSINNNCTANVYQNNTYFESIFNLFNNQGYTTNSFHDYYDWYYDRSVIHKNMGSGTFYDAVDLDLDFSYNYPAYDTWASDEELMEKYLEIIDENESKESHKDKEVHQAEVITDTAGNNNTTNKESDGTWLCCCCIFVIIVVLAFVFIF